MELAALLEAEEETRRGGERGWSIGRGLVWWWDPVGPERNVTTPNCLIPGRAMRELIGNTGARGCVHGRMLGGQHLPHVCLRLLVPRVSAA